MKINILVLVFLFSIDSIFAQCSMCKAVAESAGAEKEGFFEGLNSGILYLMVTPYILLTIGAIFFYLNRKKSIAN
tara:strand:+ start:303 stop:527 length:225 start_codon:yes stop_codon:yes gene_type:complete